jgi:hypothetical protein
MEPTPETITLDMVTLNGTGDPDIRVGFKHVGTYKSRTPEAWLTFWQSHQSKHWELDFSMFRIDIGTLPDEPWKQAFNETREVMHEPNTGERKVIKVRKPVGYIRPAEATLNDVKKAVDGDPAFVFFDDLQGELRLSYSDKSESEWVDFWREKMRVRKFHYNANWHQFQVLIGQVKDPNFSICWKEPLTPVTFL